MNNPHEETNLDFIAASLAQSYSQQAKVIFMLSVNKNTKYCNVAMTTDFSKKDLIQILLQTIENIDPYYLKNLKN